MTQSPLPLTARLPFLLVAAVVGAATIFVAAVRLTDRVGLNPWEPAIAMEAVRLNAGLPIYESAHATHMYGPLLTVALAGIFRITGLSLLAARIVMSIGAAALCVFLALVFSRSRALFWCAFATLLFLGINFRTNLALLSAQPDCVAILVAAFALFLWAKKDQTAFLRVASIALLVVAMLFKQTATAFAVVPIVYVLLWQRPLTAKALIISTMPAAIIGFSLLILKIWSPEMFHAMVNVPASIQVHWERAPKIFFYFVATFPILFLGVLALLSKSRRIDERDRWATAAFVVLVPASIWAICKSGGSYNSLLPAYAAVVALFVSRLDVMIEWMGKVRYRLLASAAVSLVVLLSFLVQFDRVIQVLGVRNGDENYDAVIATARQLNGMVISPQDATIAYRATGYIGRSLIFELDTHAVNGNWPAVLPESLSQELESAKFVVQVKSFVPNPMFDGALPEHGFSPMPVEALTNSVYTIWSKTPQ